MNIEEKIDTLSIFIYNEFIKTNIFEKNVKNIDMDIFSIVSLLRALHYKRNVPIRFLNTFVNNLIPLSEYSRLFKDVLTKETTYYLIKENHERNFKDENSILNKLIFNDKSIETVYNNIKHSIKTDNTQDNQDDKDIMLSILIEFLRDSFNVWFIERNKSLTKTVIDVLKIINEECSIEFDDFIKLLFTKNIFFWDSIISNNLSELFIFWLYGNHSLEYNSVNKNINEIKYKVYNCLTMFPYDIVKNTIEDFIEIKNQKDIDECYINNKIAVKAFNRKVQYVLAKLIVAYNDIQTMLFSKEFEKYFIKLFIEFFDELFVYNINDDDLVNKFLDIIKQHNEELYEFIDKNYVIKVD